MKKVIDCSVFLFAQATKTQKVAFNSLKELN